MGAKTTKHFEASSHKSAGPGLITIELFTCLIV